jgi:hypothetical protein
MPAQRLLLAAACCAVLLATTACGDTGTASPTATRPAAIATFTRPSTPQLPTPVNTPQPIGPSPTAAPAPTPPAGTKFEPAPIDGAELLVEASNSAQYAVHITLGLPSGCHVFDHTTLTRTGPEMIIEVVNRLPADTTIACTAIYGTHETTVQLGGDFASGATYRVHVNERTIEFMAQ